jgi:hypothetical protein
VSVTLSPPIRIFAFAGVLVAVGLVAFFFVMGQSTSEPDLSSAPAVTRPTTKPEPTTAAPAKPAAPRTAPARRPRATTLPPSGLPLPVHRALRRNKVVVVAVYMPGASVDSFVRAEARAGARAGRAGFVPLSALSERLVQPLVAKTGVLPDPAVVVLKRPGVVAATLGVTDSETVAQAVAQARK